MMNVLTAMSELCDSVGGEERLRELLVVMVASLETRRGSMLEAAHRDDRALMGAAAHACRPMALLVGATELARMSAALELAVDAHEAVVDHLVIACVDAAEVTLDALRLELDRRGLVS